MSESLISDRVLVAGSATVDPHWKHVLWKLPRKSREMPRGKWTVEAALKRVDAVEPCEAAVQKLSLRDTGLAGAVIYCRSGVCEKRDSGFFAQLNSRLYNVILHQTACPSSYLTAGPVCFQLADDAARPLAFNCRMVVKVLDGWRDLSRGESKSVVAERCS